MNVYPQYSADWWAQEAPATAIQCKATSKRTGIRCGRAVKFGSLLCKNHGGAAGQVQRKARERVLLAADDAIQQITRLMEDTTIPAPVRLQAARDLADRADLGASSKVDLTVHKWQDIAESILIDVGAGDGRSSPVDPTYDTADPVQGVEPEWEPEPDTIRTRTVPAAAPTSEPERATGKTPRHIKERFGLRH